MGFVYQVPETVGGTVLIIERIESQNYAAGVAGWAIMADGTAEFGDLVARGSLTTGVAPGQRIEIGTAAHPDAIAFYSGDPAEVSPGILESSTPGNASRLTIESPAQVLNAIAFINLEGYDDGHSAAEMQADNFSIIGGDTLRLISDLIKLGDSTPNGDLVVESSAPEFHAVIRNEDETWHGTAATPLAGTWVDTAGSRFGYYKDAAGRVQIRGRVSGGGAGATVVTLPGGYRPSSNLEFTMRAGTVVSAVSVSTAGVLTVTANLATASGSGINLDCISFPTF